MPTRAESLANQFEQAVNDFAQAIEKCPDDKWHAVHGDEGYTVAALAQHVSGQFPLEMEYITAAAEGKPLPGYTWDDINNKNDTRAAANSKASKADVLKELRDGVASVASYLRGLSDEQFDNAGNLALAGGASVTLEQMVMGGVLIDHVQGHMKSIPTA